MAEPNTPEPTSAYQVLVDYFIAAAGKGDLATVAGYSSQYKDLDVVDSRGMSGIHAAAAAGHLEVIQFLDQKGADIYLKVPVPETTGEKERIATAPEVPVHDGDAASSSKRPGNENKISYAPIGWAAIDFAADAGHAKAIKFLAKKVAINTHGPDGYTPAHRAAKKGHLEALVALAEVGADMHANIVIAETIMAPKKVTKTSPLDLLKEHFGPLREAEFAEALQKIKAAEKKWKDNQECMIVPASDQLYSASKLPPAQSTPLGRKGPSTILVS